MRKHDGACAKHIAQPDVASPHACAQPGWLQEASMAASRQLPVLEPRQIASLFAALQSLGAPLDKEWVDEVNRGGGALQSLGGLLWTNRGWAM